MRFPFESKLINYVTSWYQIQDKPRSGQRRFHGAHTARIAASCNIRKQKRPAGEFPLQVLWRRSAAGTVKSICHPRGKKGCGDPCAALRRARRIAAARRGKRKGESSGDAGCGGRRPKTQKRPAGGCSPAGLSRRMPRTRRPRRARAAYRKAPSASATPCPPAA